LRCRVHQRHSAAARSARRGECRSRTSLTSQHGAARSWPAASRHDQRPDFRVAAGGIPVRARRFFATEVVQTSGTDCGPASLKSLLDGFGLPVSYDRLRDACHTNVDGTSLDTLEELANQLGLNAEQVIVPEDHVLLGESAAFPAIAVVRNPDD